jgi:LuxR family transcriptional regulator, maltose regulon positive regulatory protein
MLIGIQPQLIATKILLPRSVPGLVQRPRLLDLVAQVQAKQLTIIKAGAGFGKTSLALSWAERLQQSGNAVAWLAIDTEDNEPTRFLFYLSQALRRGSNGVGEDVVDLISEGTLNLPRTIVSMLINDLTNIDDELFLFLDDYQWLTHPEIQSTISFLLRRAPSNFHLVLITRSEPPVSLTQLRAQNRLLEVDAFALRFSLDETRAFLELEQIGRIESADVRAVHAKTEGWPAILRIIASTFSQSGEEFGQFASKLSGAAHTISTYFDESLHGLSGDMVQFMLRTAILARFSAPLCRAVTEVDDSRGMLDSIGRRQLLLTPLDQEHRWYRYHPLLGGYLRRRLEEQSNEEIPMLQQRASRWFAANEMWAEAIQYALSSGNADEAASWIENCAMTLVKRGDMLTLLNWQRALPAELMRRQIKVRLAIAWGLSLVMRSEEALQLVAEIEQDLINNEGPAREALICECLTIRAIAVAVADDSHQALQIAESCLDRHPSDPWTANAASNVARFGYWKGGNLDRFYATPWVAHSDDDDRWNVLASIYRLCLQGLAEIDQLRVDEAERLYLDAMSLAERHVGPNSVAAALPASLIAQRRYQQGRLEDAESLVIDRLPIINAAGMLECVACAYFTLVKIALCRKNPQRAFALLGQTEDLGRTRNWGRLLAMTEFWRFQIYLTGGQVSDARACLDRLERLADRYPARHLCAWSAIHFITAFARASLAVADDRPQEAAETLRELHHEAEMKRWNYFALMLGTELSKALLAANKPFEALQVFCDVFKGTASAGIYQMLLDGGPQIGKLLQMFCEHARRTGQSRELLPHGDSMMARWRERYEPSPVAKPAIAVMLSARERNIIDLIAQGQSNKEIARGLGIAPETVKTHVKHIFVKLEVDKRTRAIARAQSLGIVATQ